MSKLRELLAELQKKEQEVEEIEKYKTMVLEVIAGLPVSEAQSTINEKVFELVERLCNGFINQVEQSAFAQTPQHTKPATAEIQKVDENALSNAVASVLEVDAQSKMKPRIFKKDPAPITSVIFVEHQGQVHQAVVRGNDGQTVTLGMTVGGEDVQVPFPIDKLVYKTA